MPIPSYMQEISDFRTPNGHPSESDFIAEGLTSRDPATGLLIWNPAGQAVIDEIISTRFEMAVELHELVRELEPKLARSQIARQLVARGYYSMFWAGRAVSLTLCARDWGMGSGNHGNLPTHLEIHTRSDAWYPHFHRDLTRWRALRNCADYNLFPVLVYSGRHAGRRPKRVGRRYITINQAAIDVGNEVEEYLRQSQRLIISRGVRLVRTT